MGTFGISEGSINRKKHTHTQKNKKTKEKKPPQNSRQMAITSGEEAHKLASARSACMLGAEAQASSLVLRVRTGVECPEDTLRVLM